MTRLKEAHHRRVQAGMGRPARRPQYTCLRVVGRWVLRHHGLAVGIYPTLGALVAARLEHEGRTHG